MTLLLVALPLYVAYLFLVELPRESLRGWVWSVGRRGDALPGSQSEPARRRALKRLIEQAGAFDAGTVARVAPGLAVVPSGDIELEVHDAPAELRDTVRAVRRAASDAVTRRALIVAPDAVDSAPDAWDNLHVTGPAWRHTVAALESAASAAILGRALDAATRERWIAPWRELLDAHAAAVEA